MLSFFFCISDSRSRSSCWQLATMALGVVCLSSVAATGEKNDPFLEEFTHPGDSTDIKIMILEETAIADKADQVLFCFQGYKCTPCPETWLQYGENCYYFSKEWKTWQESKARCSALESRFLKIESKKELDFVMQSAQSYSSYSFWTGLSHNGSEGPWLWEDGSAFSTDLFQIQEVSSSPFLECVWLQGSNIGAAQCGEYKFCICEKMVDPAVIEQVNYLDRQ
uniref:C-type lectin domain-containing protein n=1 Tax=Anser brachyrhynchus TaxID=132585 RepID=A0A8B9BYB6_9AVES